MTSRRTFLRVLGAAVIGAVVAPQIPLPAPVAKASAHTWWRSQAALGSSPPLTLAMLQEAFEKCSRGGSASPQYLVTSRQVAETYARMCGLVYDLEIAA